MRRNEQMLVLLSCLFLTSCSIDFNAYIRNMTDALAVVDVYLLNKEHMKTLPNKVRVANRVVSFKCGYRKHIDSLQNVYWVDVNHFQLAVAPKTTVDLTDMAGRFHNGSATENIMVTVTVGNRTDTILNGNYRQDRQKFDYKSMGFGTPVLYHDIKLTKYR